MTTDTNRLEELITLLEETRDDHDKFFNSGNNAAGTRVRKAMQQIKSSAHDVRIHVQATKKSQ